MNIRVDIYVFSLDYTINEYLILLSDGYIISYEYNEGDIATKTKEVIGNIFEINGYWLNLKLIDVHSDERDFVITYSCLMPTILKSKTYNWENIGKINDENTKQIIMQILRKTTC